MTYVHRRAIVGCNHWSQIAKWVSLSVADSRRVRDIIYLDKRDRTPQQVTFNNIHLETKVSSHIRGRLCHEGCFDARECKENDIVNKLSITENHRCLSLTSREKGAYNWGVWSGQQRQGCMSATWSSHLSSNVHINRLKDYTGAFVHPCLRHYFTFFQAGSMNDFACWGVIMKRLEGVNERKRHQA